MKEKDFQRIEKMVASVVDSRLEKVEERFDAKLGEVTERFDAKLGEVTERFDAKLGEVTERFDAKLGVMTERFDAKLGEVTDRFDAKLGVVAIDFDKKLEGFKDEIKEDFRHQLGFFTEDIHKKLQLVAEGHQLLSEKLDRVEKRLEKKIDGVAADLTAHRADTEGHKRGYIVREPEG